MSAPSYFRVDGWVKSAIGAAVPGAQIYVCTQPANLTVPPTPLANIFSDPLGVVPITQPIITDGFGHYDFYVAPGTYTVIVALSAVIQQTYPDQTVGLSGPGSATTLLIEVNGSSAGSQTLLNFQQGTGLTISDNGSGQLTFSVLQPYIDIAGFCPGTLTNTQEIARYNVAHACTVPTGATLSLATASAASTGTATVTLNKISGGTTTAIGTVTFTAGNKTGNFTFSAPVNFAAGDQVQFVSASADATLAGVAITLVATRTA